MPKRYPLDWPRQQERTLPAHRTRSRFSSKSLISQWHEDADLDEVKRTFRARAAQLHPDRGGDPAKWTEFNDA